MTFARAKWLYLLRVNTTGVEEGRSSGASACFLMANVLGLHDHDGHRTAPERWQILSGDAEMWERLKASPCLLCFYTTRADRGPGNPLRSISPPLVLHTQKARSHRPLSIPTILEHGCSTQAGPPTRAQEGSGRVAPGKSPRGCSSTPRAGRSVLAPVAFSSCSKMFSFAGRDSRCGGLRQADAATRAAPGRASATTGENATRLGRGDFWNGFGGVLRMLSCEGVSGMVFTCWDAGRCASCTTVWKLGAGEMLHFCCLIDREEWRWQAGASAPSAFLATGGLDSRDGSLWRPAGGGEISMLQLERVPIDRFRRPPCNSSPCIMVTTHSDCAWYPAMACFCHWQAAHIRKGKPLIMPRGVGMPSAKSAERLVGG